MGSELKDNPVVNDIKVYWNLSKEWNDDKTDHGYHCNWNFNENNMWEGQFILYEDGWFEGVAKDSNSEYAMEGLIFGTYFPNQSIELVKIIPNEVSSFIYRGKRDAKGYEGQVAIIDLIKEELYGNNHIITRENKEHNLKELATRINKTKEFLHDDNNRYLYEYMKNEFLKNTTNKAEVNSIRK